MKEHILYNLETKQDEGNEFIEPHEAVSRNDILRNEKSPCRWIATDKFLEDGKDLRLQGCATDHIWIMEHEETHPTHPIGIRLDCGDSGTVYLSRSQAKDLAQQLSEFMEVARPDPQERGQ